MSLWARIVLLTSLVLVLCTVLLGGSSLFLLQRSLLNELDSNLNDRLVPMAQVAMTEQVSPGSTAGGTSSLGSPFDFSICWEDCADGAPTYPLSQSGATDTVVHFPDLSLEQVADMNGRGFVVRDSDGKKWRAIAAIAQTPEDERTVLYAAMPLATTEGTVRDMAAIVALTGMIVIGLGMVGTGLVAQRILVPLRTTEATARRIAAGNLALRVPVDGSSMEVRRLTKSVNEMLNQIEVAFSAQAASEQHSRAAEERMRRFVADASHELRTPLAAIRGFGELYRMGAIQGDEDISSAMRRIEDESKRMGSLVEDLLRLARMDENVDLELAPLDLTDALFDAAQDLRAIDPERDVVVCDLEGMALSLEPHVPMAVQGNESSLRQVLMNLVGNANRHTPRGSPVELAIGPLDDTEMALEIRDHGEGIDDEQKPKVFERFYRTDSSRQRTGDAGGGAGLGLSIVRKIVDGHHGRIEVRDTAGGGSTFRVVLLRATAEPATASAPDQVRPIGTHRADPSAADEEEVTPPRDAPSPPESRETPESPATP